jgi:hypothetical protein
MDPRLPYTGVHHFRRGHGTPHHFPGLAEEELGVLPNRLFDADTRRHCAAKRAGELTPRGAMPARAGQLRR